MKKAIIILLLTICMIGLVFASTRNIDRGDYSIVYETESVEVPNIVREYVYKDPICDTQPVRDRIITCDNDTFYYYESVQGRKTVVTERKRIGVQVGKLFFKNANYVNGTIYEWSFDVSKRNFNEYPVCLDYELRKGVCIRYKVR